MKTTKEIANDILQSLGQQDNPVGILLESYLKTVIKDIVIEHITGFHMELSELLDYLSDEGKIIKYDWKFEDRAQNHIIHNPIK